MNKPSKLARRLHGAFNTISEVEEDIDDDLRELRRKGQGSTPYALLLARLSESLDVHGRHIRSAYEQLYAAGGKGSGQKTKGKARRKAPGSRSLRGHLRKDAKKR